jgi:hypothetical protein
MCRIDEPSSVCSDNIRADLSLAASRGVRRRARVRAAEERLNTALG